MRKPFKALTDYFSMNILSLGVDEEEYARKILRIFDIKSSNDLWKISAYINYKSDTVESFSQQMQTLDFTIWRGEGDCEDHVRALKKVTEALGLKTYWWLVFQDTGLQQGHAMLLFIDEKGYLTCLNYTQYFKVLEDTITEDDIKNETEKFKKIIKIMNYAVFPTQRMWNVSYIIKTDKNEKPLWYVDAPTQLVAGKMDYQIYPDTRLAIVNEITRLKAWTRITIYDVIPLAALGFGLWYLFKRR